MMSQNPQLTPEKQAEVQQAFADLSAVFYESFLQALAQRGYPVTNEKQAESLLNIAFALQNELQQIEEKTAEANPYQYLEENITGDTNGGIDKEAASILNEVYTQAEALMQYNPRLFQAAATIAALR